MNLKFNIFYILITLGFIILSVSVHDDYGLTWDEFRNRKYAQEVTKTLGETKYNEVLGDYGYIEDGDMHAASRGPLFLIALNKVEELLVQDDLSKAFKLRRLFSNLFFILSGVIFLFFLKNIFKDNKVIIISYFMYFLSPRIFAHSFFNPVDIPFLCFFTFYLIGIYYLIKKINVKTISIIAVLSAIITSLRVVGEISIPITILILFSPILSLGLNKTVIKKFILNTSYYLFITISTYLLITPYLWSNTWQSLMEIHNQAINYKPIIFQILYWGKLYKSISLPWHYTLSWIFISIPSVYVVALITSYLNNIFSLKGLIKSKQYYQVSLFLILTITLFSACYFNYSKYNDWRHFYFLYPVFILLIAFSIDHLRNIKLKTAIFILFVIQFAFTGHEMIKYHPYQYSYFNQISGGIKAAENNFPLDYFGSSYKQGLIEILKHEDKKTRIKVAFYPYPPGEYNLLCLQKNLRERFEISSTDNADYILSKWIFEPYIRNIENLRPYLFKKLLVNDVPIHHIYKRVENRP